MYSNGSPAPNAFLRTQRLEVGRSSTSGHLLSNSEQLRLKISKLALGVVRQSIDQKSVDDCRIFERIVNGVAKINQKK